MYTCTCIQLCWPLLDVHCTMYKMHMYVQCTYTCTCMCNVLTCTCMYTCTCVYAQCLHVDVVLGGLRHA